MIDTPSVVGSLHTLANKVQSSDPGARDRLVLLSQAVQNPTQADAWASSDIYQMIDPEGIVERYKSKTLAQPIDRVVVWLEITRNMVILFPIIFTWYGISQATAKYDELISALTKDNTYSQSSQLFLYLWQRQFGGRLPWFLTLSSIAIGDVILLFIILAITFLAYWLSNRSEEAKLQVTQQLRADIVHTIAIASLCLRGKPQLTAGDNMEKVAQQIADIAQQIPGQFNTMMQSMADSFDRMAQNTTERFDEMVRELLRQFTMSSQQINVTIQQTEAQLSSIAQELMKQLHLGDDYLLKLGSLTAGIVQLSTEIQSAADQLKQTNGALTSSINRLVAPAEAMARQQEKLLEEVQKSAGLLQGTFGAINDLVIRQQKMSAELTDVLDTLTLAVERFDKLAREQEKALDQQTTFLQHIQIEHDKQAQLAILMSDATVSVKNVLSELNNGAISVHSIALNMNDLLRLQVSRSSLPAGAPATNDLTDVLQCYTDAAQAMESSGNALKASAIAIQRASQQLRDVLDDVQRGKNSHN